MKRRSFLMQTAGLLLTPAFAHALGAATTEGLMEAIHHAQEAGDSGKNRALIVGISVYKDYHGLPGAAPDARRLANALSELDFEVTAFEANAGVTFKKQAFVNSLREFATECKPDDLLVFYFAGHGSRRGGRDYLLLSDTTEDDADPKVFERTAFALGTGAAADPPDSLAAILRTCKAKRRLIIIDACRNTSLSETVALLDPPQTDKPPTLPSGGKAGAPKPPKAALINTLDARLQQRLDTVVRAAPPGVSVQGVVLYACSPGETSKEDEAKKAGLFTLALEGALKGEARDDAGRLTLGNVLRYVREHIPKDGAGKRYQTPTLNGDGAEQFLLCVFQEPRFDIIHGRNPKDGADMVWVPGSKGFCTGTAEWEVALLLKDVPEAERETLREALAQEQPNAGEDIQGYWLYSSLVTVGQFRKFREAMRTEQNREIRWPPFPSLDAYNGWKPIADALPMVNISAADAASYAAWVSGELPTEAQWELAARGPGRRIFPWGNVWNPAYANSSVGAHPAQGPAGPVLAGKSPYGALDMAGNLWQWCRSGAKLCLHGGSWKETDPLHLRSAYCHGDGAGIQNDGVIGFRVALRGELAKYRTNVKEP